MQQIRVTNKTKVLIDNELALHKQFAKELGEPLPSMPYIVEVLILEGLSSMRKARARQGKKNEN